jgi:hypothetical protein
MMIYVECNEDGSKMRFGLRDGDPEECRACAVLNEGLNNEDGWVPSKNIASVLCYGIASLLGKNIEAEVSDEQARQLYEAYPRKAAKPYALKMIVRRLKEGADFDAMMAAVQRFAEAVKPFKGQHRWIPHASTWFNQRRDEDPLPAWIEEAAEEVKKRQVPNGLRKALEKRRGSDGPKGAE